ncbi:telomere length regulation protein-domain-containing protein [Pelagophyceae sp. CCMP2097]|nr:telomere length regulation protein-domain-containing protein [Pelagophyceae sp. CCMP2097]
MAERPRAVAALRDALRLREAHEIGLVQLGLEHGHALVAGGGYDATSEMWLRFVLHEVEPRWRGLVTADDACRGAMTALAAAAPSGRLLVILAEGLDLRSTFAADLVDANFGGGGGRLAAALGEADEDDEDVVDAAARIPLKAANALKQACPASLQPRRWYATLARELLDVGDGARFGAAVARLEMFGIADDLAAAWVAAPHRAQLFVSLRGASLESVSVALLRHVAASKLLLDATLGARLAACDALLLHVVASKIVVGRFSKTASAARHRARGRAVCGVPLLAAPYVVGLLRAACDAGAWASTFSAVAQLWGSKDFLRGTDDGRPGYVTAALVAFLRRSTRAEVERADVLTKVLDGVSAHFDSNDACDRYDGMVVGEAFGVAMSQPLDFEDLPAEHRGRAEYAAEPDEAQAPARAASKEADEKALTKPKKKRKAVAKAASPDDVINFSSSDDDGGGDSDSDASDASGASEASDATGDDLEAYASSDDGGDLAPAQRPRYLRDLIAMLYEKEGEFARDRQRVALDAAEELVRSEPADLSDVSHDLARALLHCENAFAFDNFRQRTAAALAARPGAPPRRSWSGRGALAALRPTAVVGEYLAPQFFEAELTVNKRLEILETMVAAAHEITRGAPAAIADEAPRRLVAGTTSRRRSAIGGNGAPPGAVGTVAVGAEARTRRWGYRRNAAAAPRPNLFGALAPRCFFFPLLRGYAGGADPFLGRDAYAQLLKARVCMALTCFLECAAATPAAQLLAQHLLAFAWAERASADAALRRAALAATLSAVTLCRGAPSLAGAPALDDVADAVGRAAQDDADSGVRDLAGRIRHAIPL